MRNFHGEDASWKQVFAPTWTSVCRDRRKLSPNRFELPQCTLSIHGDSLEKIPPAGLDATCGDGLMGLVLWDSDTGSDIGTCGIGLGWGSTWDNDELTGPGRQEVQGPEQVMGGASASTDGGGGQGSGKNKKIIADTLRKLNINREDLWVTPDNPRWEKGQPEKDLQVLHGTERQSLGREPKDGEALETLALLYTRFEQVNSDMAMVDKDLDKEFSRMLDEMEKSKKPNGSWR